MKPVAGAAIAAVSPPASSERSGSDCTDCSHRANRSRPRTGAGVRVSVDLRQFFSDQRARVFMWAPHGRRVQWLAQRVARSFGLPDHVALVSRGHVLPATEPLLMLDRDDPIQVVNMSHVFTPYDKNDEPNVPSRRTTSGPTERSSPAQPTARPIHSNVTIEQESANRLPSGCQGASPAEHQNTSRVSSVEGMDMTMQNADERQGVDESEHLQQLKRRALRLLDERCHMLQEASPPKRLRRRRRRRKPQAAADEPDASDDGSSVLRNGSGSRSPRLVSALPPAPQHVRDTECV